MAKPLSRLKIESQALLDRSKWVASDWLLTDLEVSMGFAQVALDENSSPEKRRRNRFNARRGYDAITYFSKKVEMPESRRGELRARIRQLRALLKKAGETFPDKS